MATCLFCENEFEHDIEKYCCYWCELHGKMRKNLLSRLEIKQKSMVEKNHPKIAIGLAEAILIVKSEFYAKK
jgi:hypothetical protein